jgi:hypothetical protein
MLPQRSAAIISIIAAVAGLLASSLNESVVAQQSDGGAVSVTISGTVYDSLSGRPLAGALVQLAPSDLRAGVSSAPTDSSGSFVIGGVQPGEYLIGFTHPFLDSLGLDVPPLKLKVDGTRSITIPLAIPTALAVRAEICPATQPGDSSGLMLGFLRDADSGMHLDSGTVVLEWTAVVATEGGKRARAESRSLAARATSAGWYAVCGVPTGWPVTAQARNGDDASGFVNVQMDPRGVLHRDFGIPRDSAATIVTAAQPDGVDATPVRRGSARLTGTVRDENGRPLAGTKLAVWGSGLEATSRDDGTFAISQLPAGTQTLESRHVGYSPERVTVDLLSDRTVSITVAMTQRVDVLNDVIVYGKDSELKHVLAGFDQRRRLGFGHFVTRADIEKARPLRFTDLVRSTPGVKVVPSGNSEYTIVSSREYGNRCRSDIYINGTRLADPSGIDVMVDPNEVAAIEIYAGSSDTPPQFGRGKCGSVVIWTVPNLPPIGEQR